MSKVYLREFSHNLMDTTVGMVKMLIIGIVLLIIIVVVWCLISNLHIKN